MTDADQDPQNPTDPTPDVGGVGEEAVKLLGALSDWARDHGADVGEGLAAGGLSGLAAQAAASAREINEHVATGAAECAYCPVCRAVHAVRQTSPEVRAHLSTAAASLLQAAAGLLASVPAPDSEQGSSGRAPGVERIDLDDDEGEGER